ncbi:MAG: acetyltransferase [Zoogloeaceae bacterium]|jgi:sugar O-acyltransferase (sialic acid O-acetyltransferase NeuD family)|nr:acetyltransferase [Zoogloeaceae bacterium]
MGKRLIIIGAGGLGRIVYDALLRDSSVHAQFSLAGFLDTRADLSLPPDLDVPILGNPLTWQPGPEDIFIPAVGNPQWRKNLVEPLILKGAHFFSYTCAAFVASRTTIGEGAFLTPGAVISTDCKIGAFGYCDTGVIVGHDVEIGDHCMIGAMSFLSGGVCIGEGVAIHPRAAIAKDVRIGDGAVIGIGSVVLRDVSAHATVLGNPARIIGVNAP